MEWEQLSADMSDQLQQRLINYWQNAEPLPKAANDELDYVASKLGLYNGDALLRRTGLALMDSGIGLADPYQQPNGQLFSPLGYPSGN